MTEREWQPIETAPKDGTDILVAFPKNVGWLQIVRWWEKKTGFQWVDGYTCKRIWNSPTHWQPLPPPPKEEG